MGKYVGCFVNESSNIAEEITYVFFKVLKRNITALASASHLIYCIYIVKHVTHYPVKRTSFQR